ncbi:MAG: tRNA guanosine(34) transglycosylase Tgt [Clostridiales bacterium]|jgi:queuine tRNA-ribosyltransferase|nr:tRNA guanosine(34) transglycosylase Tgt [Clostridiales bacterium]
MSNYKIISQDGKAKCAEFKTLDGLIKTPVFMNVATCAAIKGGLSSIDLKNIKCEVLLANTYHLHLRPGDELINNFGGIKKFINWNKPVLTDSAGFQVFSLSKMRKICEEGVYFNSHIDGKKIFIGPEESMLIQQNINSTIAMAFDECTPYTRDKNYIKNSIDRTTRWLKRCIKKNTELNKINNKNQILFGINQGGIFKDLRIEHAKVIRELDLEGYSIGGVCNEKDYNELYEIVDCVTDYLPENKPTYLMGVGSPENILECVFRGIDFFDCVLPARNARHAHVYTSAGKLNLLNSKYKTDNNSIDLKCNCETCKNFSRGYINHLFKAKEILAMRLCVIHNLYFYNNLMREIREAIKNKNFVNYKNQKIYELTQKN